MNARTGGVGLGPLWGLVCMATAWAQAPSVAPTVGAARSPTVFERGPHSTRWEYTLPMLGLDGQVTNVPQRYVQLESGLNYRDPQGRWQASGMEIELAPGGAQWVRGQQQVTFSAELNEVGAVQVRTAEGQLLKTRILGLAYYDLDTGQSVLIAELQNSTGELLPNKRQVLYPNAFTDVAADVRYTVTRSSFEQDIVLREQPPSPADYGLSPNAVLEVLTEFFDPPTPAEETRAPAAASQLVATNRLAVGAATPAPVGDRLTFGSLSVGEGRAFLLEGTDPGVPIVRTWQRLEGRQFLIESVPLPLIRAALEQLPPAPPKQAQRSATDVKRYVQVHRPPARRQTASARPLRRAAEYAASRPGLVLDYRAVSGSFTNLTFQGDMTYYVTGPLYLSGVTTIEGGTVVKFANTNDPCCQVSGTIVCQTDFYTPAFFTAKDDNRVGATISGGTGTPSGWYASTALAIQDNVTDLRNLRVAWATNAIAYAANSGWPHYLTHVQVVNCNSGVSCQSPMFWVRNGLFHNVQTVFSTASSGGVGHLEHLTVDTANYFNGSSSYLTVNVTNSLLVNVTSPGTSSGTGNATDTGAAFQTVGAGSHYLANGSPHRNAGTGNIGYQLQSDFRNFTTYPPLVVSGPVTANTTWGPQAARDASGTPDRGYHYPALDYAVGSVTVSNCVVTVQPGTAIGQFGQPSLLLENSAQMVAQGTADQMIQFVPYTMIQEQPLDWGNGLAPVLIYGPIHPLVIDPPPPSLTVRFARFSQPGGIGWSIYSQTAWFAFTLVRVQDCQFLNTWNQFWGNWGVPNTVNLKNNLFQRSPNSFVGCQTLNVYNNLFWGGSNYFLSHQVGLWTIRDNAFHNTAMTDYSAAGDYVVNDHNGYLGIGQGQLTNSRGGDVITNTFTYAAGPYGPWYRASTSLVDKGSRSAGDAGLYHDTTQASQTQETNSTVDIGFHYVAAVPAEAEIAQGSLTADGSSTCYAWSYGYAIDGLWTNPGWHNCAYNENPAYLRLALNGSQTVDRVGYVPRVMSSDWTDGSWNGVYRQYNLYVTDDASGTPANWGAPVASGEWFWPNLQERRDLSFAPKAGRYVIFQRVTAWGWYGPQDPYWADYGYPPGLANANEVWVYRRDSLWPAALDTDGDGLPDWYEDANGNGSVDTGETGWNSASDAGLKVWITRPANGSPVP